MPVDASAVARVVGIATQFVDLRQGAIQYLPQRIALLGQGQSDVSYSTTKWPFTTLAEAGAKFGYKSPIYAMLRELVPSDGREGIGSIPITVYPLAEGGGAAAAAGDITPSGTPTFAASYRARIGGVLSNEFVIDAGALATAANQQKALRRMGDAISAVLHMPGSIAYAYGTVTAAAIVGTGDGTIGTFTTTGKPKPGTYRVENTAAVVNGGVWKVTDPDGNVVTGLTMTPGAGTATPFTAFGLGFTLTDGTQDFGLGAYFDVTVPATKLNFTSGWKGATANGIKIEILPTSAANETVFAITQPTGGLVSPAVDNALSQMGEVWETMVLNGNGADDTVALDALKAAGDGRWGELMHKPFVAFFGNTTASRSVATAITSARTADKVNCQLVAPGSPNLPFVVAARELARIVKVANDNPPCDYGSQQADGLVPGNDGDQWTYPLRDQALKAGSSTVQVKDQIIHLSDTITMYAPTGEAIPPYRYVCDIVKLQQVIYNLQLNFATPEWDGAPLIPDNEISTNERTKKPEQAKTLIAAMIDSLADAAIIVDRAFSKKSIKAVINSQNPKRLDVEFIVKVSGNANVLSFTVKWGFNFGVAAAA